MLILGIDPGFAIVGFGLVEADRGRPVPRPLVYLPPSEPRRGPPGQRAL